MQTMGVKRQSDRVEALADRKHYCETAVLSPLSEAAGIEIWEVPPEFGRRWGEFTKAVTKAVGDPQVVIAEVSRQRRAGVIAPDADVLLCPREAGRGDKRWQAFIRRRAVGRIIYVRPSSPSSAMKIDYGTGRTYIA